ncbi:MAG: N-acetyltransferase 10 [Chrysothrix sp. TS-e1954]|nr:MAG: N-acetyltransferase 10 [Chrysothrix sp. TS-e1954]
MVKKAIDSRIPALIRNGVQDKKRSFFVVVGDRQKDVIVNLYHILLNVDIKLNKNVLWAYKSQLLGFTSHRKKREKKIRKEIKRGIREADTEDPFELFLSTQNIRYVYYKETEKILGNTYGICILQDFEAITPNLLARTIETVEGGGLVILLLKGMNSLKQLYTLSMDAHSRYRTEAHADVTARFNERFILSLGSCDSCLVVDDELNVLPISGGKYVKPLPPPEAGDAGDSSTAVELRSIKESNAEKQPVGSLVTLAKTVDQAKALLTFVEAISEKTLQSTVALTAARGRGKSAALGVAVAAAIAHGYSNIFITSPSPENLKTLFEFIMKGFDALNYLDHVDYDIMQSTNPDFNKAIVRINVHRQHRQTIQYIQPQDHFTLSQAELLVIDEAAAIPLPLVRNLMGPYLVFLSSTVNGYEGTGRSLSLKLISQLREQNIGRNGATQNGDNAVTVSMSRKLREITLSEPIRYSAGDATEKWLNRLLCLDATLPQRSSFNNLGGTPHPSQCELLAVNRDTLFSFHKVSEAFLHSMLSLYVASHYKNSPNDLQLMSDAPAHLLYALVPPTSEDTNRLPEPLCVIQVALEGQISRQSVQHSLARGQRAAGDLIPWTISQQFQDDKFAGLSGARIVRIATNPEYIGMGYGRRAVQLLLDFYSGKFLSLSEDDSQIGMQQMIRVTDEELASSSLQSDNVKVRDIKAMPPLFSRLSEIHPPSELDYIGVSYGLTQQLLKFWKRERFVPVYLRQTPNDLTGEHTCIMLRTITNSDDTADLDTWLPAYAKDFHRRFLSLLDCSFRPFTAVLSLSIDEAAGLAFRPRKPSTYVEDAPSDLSRSLLDQHFTPHDLRRLDSYAANMLDYHAIYDLLRPIAMLYFTSTLRNVIQLSHVQSALLLATGFQRRDIHDMSKEFGLGGPQQLLAMFVKLVRKCTMAFRRTLEGAAAEDLPAEDAGAVNGDIEMDDGVPDAKVEDGDELAGYTAFRGPEAEAGEDEDDEATKAEKERKRAMIDALPLDKYAMPGDDQDAEWGGAEGKVKKKHARTNGKKAGVDEPMRVSVKKKRKIV